MSRPETFEAKTATALRTLTSWCLVLSVALLLVVGLAVWGFARSSSANHAAHSQLGVASGAASQAQAAAAEAQKTADQVARDEAATCRVQKVGLPVQRELRFVIKGIHAVLTDPPSRAQRRAEALAPPSRRVLRDVRALDRHTSRYLQLESLQPRQRSC